MMRAGMFFGEIEVTFRGREGSHSTDWFRRVTTGAKVGCTILATALLLLRPAEGHGAYHDLVEEVTRKLERTPDDPALHFKLACAHLEHGEWKAAREECGIVRGLAAKGFEVDLIEAKALTGEGRFVDAKRLLDTLLATQPDHAAALAQRGKVLLGLNRAAEARADFDRALKLDLRAPIEWWLEAARAGDAVETLRRALVSIGDDPQLLGASLDAELAAGNIDQALERVATMKATAPRPEPWMARRARILEKAGRAGDARAAWIELRDHLLSLPNLERGTPHNASLLAEARKSLGEVTPAKAVAPPAS